MIRKLLCKLGIHKRVRGVTGYYDRCKHCGKVVFGGNYNDYTPY